MFLFVPTSAERTVYGMPWFTVGTVAICFLTWVASFYIDVWGPLGFVPADGVGLTVVLYAYAHGGLLHLLGNMVFLWCMGVNLETRWGTPAYAAVYLVGAAVSGLAYGSLHAGSTIPLVGASGAIAALMGAFLVSLFKTRIKFWYLIFYLFRVSTGTFKVPAYVEARGAGGGVAYSAHVGGFLFGFIVAGALKLSGYEKKLLESTGADVHDDPSTWTPLAAEPDRVARRYGPAGGAVPQVATAGNVPSVPPSAASEPPGATGEPARCRGCKLVNMPGATSCRRCGTAL